MTRILQRHRVAAVVLAVAVVLPLAGCPKPDTDGEPVATSKPATSKPAVVAPPAEPAAPPATTVAPDPHQRVEVRVRTISDPQDGWLRIEAIHPDAPGAWATGGFLREQNKIVIETENVDEFSINLPQLRINWDQRVILRIDDRSSELTRKRRPRLYLRRTPAGAWEVVEP
ncbi:MAG TPA: hypothetical protein VM243_05585 [Phycisphaerae bacterium]|nr:hypothetical protein [Phycisphaerae bacterium]